MTSISSRRFRLLCGALLFGLLIVSAIELKLAVINGYVRVCLAATALLAVINAGLLISALTRSHRALRLPAAVAIALLAVWALWGGRQPDADALRRAYVQELGTFEDAKYLWGGESHTGIDCSGLIRTAYYRALAGQGLAEANPALLGPRLWLFWWRDMSARAMKQGQYGYTKRIGHSRKLAGYDHSSLKPGDLAVTDSSIHVLAYYGAGRWIEANPGDGRVVINEAFAGSKRPYFNMPVTFVRWRELE